MMKGFLFGLVVLLVAASGAVADPVLSVTPYHYYVADGYRSFRVQVAGTNLNTLMKFTITGCRPTVGDVYQVFTGAGAQTPWTGDGSMHHAMDSYVMFGSLWAPPTTEGPFVTTESIVTAGGANQGMGRLNNFNNNGTPGDPSDDKADMFMRLANIYYTPDVPETGVNVFHLVLPDGDYATVAATILTVDRNPDDGNQYTLVRSWNLSTVVKCPLDGDVNQDGKVTLGDAAILGANWQHAGGWSQGDITGDGQVTLGDAAILGQNWGAEAPWYGMSEGAGVAGGAVPEPATLALLALGALCLVGYRVRGK
jgi:hypothetical protein